MLCCVHPVLKTVSLGSASWAKDGGTGEVAPSDLCPLDLLGGHFPVPTLGLPSCVGLGSARLSSGGGADPPPSTPSQPSSDLVNRDQAGVTEAVVP